MTSNVSNQGIAHLAFKAGGTPFCKSRRAHISVTPQDHLGHHRICKRCSAKAEQMAERAARQRTA